MKLRTVLLGLSGIAIALLVWHLVTLGNGIEDIPGPGYSLIGLWELTRAGVLWQNIVASIFRVAWGFCLAAAVGIPCGIAMGWWVDPREAMNPVVQMMRPISPIAWLPFATVMFGGTNVIIGGRTLFESSDLAAIFLIFLASFFPIVTATISAVRSIEQKYLRSALNFGITGRELFRRVVLPAAMPQILTGLRLALGVAWVVIVAAEMLGVQQGLGFQVNDSRNNIRNDYVAAAMIVIGLTGLGLDTMMSRLETASLARRGMSRR